VERLINSDSTVTQLWNPITLRNPEDGSKMFSETPVPTRPTSYEVPEGIYNDNSRPSILVAVYRDVMKKSWVQISADTRYLV
jgi:hypothetical protein